MRNISLSDFKSRRIRSLDDCQVFCCDRQYLYAYGRGLVIKKQGSNEKVICNLTENLYPVADTDEIPTALVISYCSEKNFVYLLLSNGDIISCDVNSAGSESIIGSVDNGIQAAQWSPGQEVIALVTGRNTVIVMTNVMQYTVSEVDLHGGGFGEKQFITVGWGKKETQFRGSEGKFNEKKKEEVSPLIDSDSTIKISWRGDAEYFAVSSLNPETSQRYLRIFSKSGALQYTSENLNGLEHCLDWRPSGNWITSSQTLPNKYVICLFEKNGLKHKEFKLPLDNTEIKVNEILWNKNSNILALLITKLSGVGSNTKCIQLFSVSNYHLYWKYTINFNSDVVPIIMQWDYLKYNTLHVVVKKKGEVHHKKYSWVWMTNKSRGSGLEDESFVAVIDGCKLNLTSFKRGIIPPPMSSYIIQLPVSINSVSFAPDNGDTSSNDLLLQLSDSSVMVYKFISKTMRHEFVGKIDKLGEEEFSYNVQWVDANVLMLCCVKIENGNSKPFLSVLDIENWNSDIRFRKKEVPLHSTIAILRGCESGAVIHENDGELYLFESETQSLSALYPGEKRNLLDFEVSVKSPNCRVIFSLDNLNKFYVNNKAVFTNVLSFQIHRSFVLLTTMKHELLCVDLEKKNLDDVASYVSDICKRQIERGSRLVTSVHKDMKVILQMPRGNLECVQPRALSLFVVGNYLNELRYREAFDLMRKQRINLNLIYDHDPVSFAKNLNVFLEQIEDLHWISLFLSDLTDEDVTKTMYSGVYKNKEMEKREGQGKSKIDVVCNMVERALSLMENPDRYLLPILTCHIKRGRIKDLETGLLKLKKLKERESSGLAPVVTFDEAFRYMLYLIDVEELYKIALGMYDFDLVLMIAGKSQKDPKEYLPFLNELKKMEPSYQKFTIDKHLKRYKKALTNLVLCDGDDVFNECISFIKAHQLYNFALKLIPRNTDRYKNVCICYGDHLMSCHSYEEAGIMYSNAGMYRNAIEAYQKSGNWQEVISCGRESKMSEDELSNLYYELAIELTEVKQFRDAATVYLDYDKNVTECVRTLAKGKLFAEAYRVSHLYQRSDLIRYIIVPAIEEQGNFTMSNISLFGQAFTKHRKRLEVVRKQKQEALESKPEIDDDLYSESNTVITQSNASRTTNRSYRSAKNRRKHERKLLSLKEGSQYEDLALVFMLHRLATNCIDLKSEVRELNKVLIKIKKDEMAEKLQNALEAVLDEIERSKSEIWTADLLSNRQSYGPDTTSNEIASMYWRSENVAPVTLDPKFAIAPDLGNDKWKLKILKS